MIAWILMPLGIAMVIYAGKIVDFLGPIDFAESFFRTGGTYTFVKLLGIMVTLLSFAYLVGGLDMFFVGVQESAFFGGKVN
jgi:hypothetical protein